MRRWNAIPVAVLIVVGAAACSSDESSSPASLSPDSSVVADSIAAASTSDDASVSTSAPDVTSAQSAPASSPTSAGPPATEPPPTTAIAATTTPVEPLQILVTNDDGYGAAGIDAVVQYLTTLPDVVVTVVAPATNQSGAGDKSTPGATFDTYVATAVTTAGGHPATAIEGFPADSVRWALGGGMPVAPDLVISGSNEGQNYSTTFIPISGTIGAAATAARNGVAAIAISQGFAHPDQAGPDYPASIRALDEYLTVTLDSYRAGQGMPLVSINVPTCPTGVVVDPEIAELYVAPPATEFGDVPPLAPAPCVGGSSTDPPDDVDAFNKGTAVLTALDPTTLAGIDFTGSQPGE